MRLPVLCLLTLLIGCATNPPRRDIQKQFIYQNDYESVWFATVGALAGLQLPMDQVVRDSGLITVGTVFLEDDSSWCDCGSAGFGVLRDARFKMSVTVSSQEQGTAVVVNARFRAVRSGMSKTWRECASTGELEAEIALQIRERMQGVVE